MNFDSARERATGHNRTATNGRFAVTQSVVRRLPSVLPRLNYVVASRKVVERHLDSELLIARRS